MNWKFLLFVTATISGTKASSCPSVNQQGCPDPSSTNFNYDHYYEWYWVSGTIPGATIFDDGTISFNSPDADHPLSGICIQWKDWTYTYVTRPSYEQSCGLELAETKGIANAWGY